MLQIPGQTTMQFPITSIGKLKIQIKPESTIKPKDIHKVGFENIGLSHGHQKMTTCFGLKPTL